ncbi:MAG: hypothetical protein GTO23_01860 [Nitrososphaeria archaeon]|nr:hypothetical protein [Nitrososphaeria archaeon]
MKMVKVVEAKHFSDRVWFRAEQLNRSNGLGWKLAVLAFLAEKILRNGHTLPRGVVDQLRLAKAKIVSGCYSHCELECELNQLEAKLFSVIVELGSEEVDRGLDLLSKAASGEITEGDINHSIVQPIISDCTTNPCSC